MDQGKFQSCVDRQAARAAVDAEMAFATAVERASATREPPKPREIAGLASSNFPSLGPPNAPVTLAVFSDFQCPYCAKFARMMRQEILPTEGGRIRLVFRYFPLDMHRWARAAAEAAACGYEQKNEFFWSLHDFFFEHQKELTPENLRQKMLDRARTIAGLDTSKFQTCLSQEKTKAAIDREVAFAGQNAIEAAPTVFLNGKIIDVVAPEQLRTLIRELGQTAPSTSAAPPRPATPRP